MLTPWAVGLSEPAAFVCPGGSLPGHRLFSWGRGIRQGGVQRKSQGGRRLPTSSISLPLPPPRYGFFSLETRLLMLPTRQCPKLKILTSLLFFPAFSCLHSFGVFPNLQALYVLFKADFAARGDTEGKI